jgi:hypothetical protein
MRKTFPKFFKSVEIQEDKENPSTVRLKSKSETKNIHRDLYGEAIPRPLYML